MNIPEIWGAREEEVFTFHQAYQSCQTFAALGHEKQSSFPKTNLQFSISAWNWSINKAATTIHKLWLFFEIFSFQYLTRGQLANGNLRMAALRLTVQLWVLHWNEDGSDRETLIFAAQILQIRGGWIAPEFCFCGGKLRKSLWSLNHQMKLQFLSVSIDPAKNSMDIFVLLGHRSH